MEADNRSARASVRRNLELVNLIGDFIFGMLGLSLGYVIRFHTFLDNVGNLEAAPPYTAYLPMILIGTIFLMFSFLQLGVYKWQTLLRPSLTMRLVTKAILIWFFLYLSVSFAVQFEPQISRIYMVCALCSIFVCIWIWKTAYSHWIRGRSFNSALTESIVFVGWSDHAQAVADAVHKDEAHPYQVKGVITTQVRQGKEVPTQLFPIVGKLEDLDGLLGTHKPDVVVIADTALKGEELNNALELCEIHYAEIKIIPNMFQILISSLHMGSISRVPILGIKEVPINHLIAGIAKRLTDIVGATVGILASAPLIIWMAIQIKKEDGGPIFYKQTRTGYLGKPFTIYKIRSMRVDAEKMGTGWTVENDPRRLKVGEFMRKWNIDEIPQFWNVIKGEMSLVGPRPERPEYIENLQREINRYNRRHHVKPGLTGWAQVNGLRGDTSLTERIRYDLFYIENANLIFDFQIMFMTFFKRDNAY